MEQHLRTQEACRGWLQGEVEAWWREGLVSATVARALLARYGLALPEGEVGQARRGRLATILGGLGAVLVGLGTLLFVASNWTAMDRPLKLGLLVGAMVASYLIAFLLREHSHPRIGAAMAFLGMLVYGASIFLVGQTYHLRVGDPLLFFLAAIGLLPIAYVTSSRPALLVCVLGVLAWYTALIVDWGAFGRWGTPHALVGVAYLAWGVALFSAAEIQSLLAWTRPFTLVTRLVGVTLIWLVLFILSFKDLWATIGWQSMEASTEPFGLFTASVIALLALAAVATAAALRLSAWSTPALLQAGGVTGIVAITAILIVLHPFPSAEPYAIVINTLAVGVVLWAAVLGVTTGRESLINAGLVLFATLAFARYVDFAWMLFDRSLVFVGAGVMLLVGGFVLERSRRLLIARAQLQEVPDAR